MSTESPKFSRSRRSTSWSKGPRTSSSFASWAISPNDRVSPDTRSHSAVSGASPAGSTNSAQTSFRELVADRPAHRPVAQPLAGIEDLLDPHALDTVRTQPLQIPRRIGEPVRMVDPRAVDHALAHELEQQRVCLLEHVRVLLAHTGEVSDVEKPPVHARRSDRCRRTSIATTDRSSNDSGRRPPCGWARRRGPAPGRRRARRPTATAARTRRRDPRTPGAGRSRRSRGWSPVAPGRRATGTGARSRGRAGRGPARAQRRTRSPRSAAGDR